MPWHVRVTPCSSSSPGFLFSVPPACRSVLNNLRSLHDYSLLSFSRVQLFATPRTAASQASLSFTISQSLLKLISIKLVSPSNHLILCHPLLLLPSIFASINAFSNESALRIRWPKYWSFIGDCSYEIKRCLLLGRKAMRNLDSILKSRAITLPTKVHIVKAMVFPVVMFRCEI